MRARRAAVTALAALLAASCGVEQPGAPATPTPTASPVGAVPQDEIGRTHRAVLALIALGELGAEKGSTQAMRSLATRTAGDGRALDAQIRELAASGGLVLGDEADPAVVGDLPGRAGRDFDEAWLRAVTDAVRQGREAAGDVRSAPGGSPEADSTATNVLARLGALLNALSNATTRAGGSG